MQRDGVFDKSSSVNAVQEMAAHLDRSTIVRVLGDRARGPASIGADTSRLRHRLVARYDSSLASFLNRMSRKELEMLALGCKVLTTGTVGELRARLWLHGAELEARGTEELGRPWQPVPIVLSGKLSYQGPLRGLCPPADAYPRPVPAARGASCEQGEPETLEELLQRASSLVGVRLGARGADKGSYGVAIAALLGVSELGFAEPDWRGEVELKSVPVVRDRAGWWRVKEDPAISMEGVDPCTKLRRVLWIARVADSQDSPVLSWYYQTWDEAVAAWAHRFLHQRPKGGAGATTKGWYLQKRFFLCSGFLRSLNG